MRRFLLILGVCLWCVFPLLAQSNKLIKELESKRGTLQKQIAATEGLLKNTKKDVGSQLSSLSALTGQIVERKRYINVINRDMTLLTKELNTLTRQLKRLQSDLRSKKNKYEASVEYLYKNKSIEEKLLFIFSAKSFSQTYRRLRYVREYANYQRIQGEDILKKQEQVRLKKRERERVKRSKETLLKEGETQKQKLEEQEKEKKAIVVSLKSKQRGLQNEINRKRREAQQLNKRIDQLISLEIERARKRAEEEARKAAKREEAEQKDHSSTDKKSPRKSKPLEAYSISKADRELSGNFVSNKGRLPMPISGSYIITSRFGAYAVEGLRNVKLDNKGLDIQGQPGAHARAIFDGKVAAVFQLNGLFNVLIRHGSYISVYCNLSSASVKSGDAVRTRQTIGTVFSDGSDGGRTVLHFQLRREREKLNPEPWLDR
ncbi:MAG: peptidase M23 [Bacteroidia bacterium]|nr:peptidase M23 [Bacteroidia bacterium]